MLDKYYKNLRSYVRSVAQEKHHALLVHSKHGIGKTYQIQQTLKDELEDKKYSFHSGYSAPFAFYQYLYNNRDRVIFLDDIDGLLQKEASLALLKQATWPTDTTNGTRRVSWESNVNMDDYPESFRFTGRIVMCFNEIPENPIMKSLVSRCLYYNLEFSYEEKLDIIKLIAKNELDMMDRERRMEVAEWLIGESYEGCGLDLRSLIKCLKFRKHSPDDWKELARGILESTGILESGGESNEQIVARLLNEHDEVEEAMEEFKEETGASRRTFYRIKKKLEESGAEF